MVVCEALLALAPSGTLHKRTIEMRKRSDFLEVTAYVCTIIAGVLAIAEYLIKII